MKGEKYVRLDSSIVRRLTGMEGFDDNVFERKPLNDRDKNIYFVNEEWYEKTVCEMVTDTIMQKGWVCQKCGRVLSRHMSGCPYCDGQPEGNCNLVQG